MSPQALKSPHLDICAKSYDFLKFVEKSGRIGKKGENEKNKSQWQKFLEIVNVMYRPCEYFRNVIKKFLSVDNSISVLPTELRVITLINIGIPIGY